MADGTTTTYGLTKPEVGSSEDTWGEKINGVIDDLDDLLDGTTPVTGIDINSGTIDGVTIGGSSAPTVTDIDINGGTIDGVTIGGASAGAVTATTITGSGDMNIDSGTLFVDATANSVGIGTTSPNLTGFGSGTNGLEIADATLAGIQLNGNAADSLYFISGSSRHWIYGKGAVPLTFSTDGTEHARIDSSGNLLVGKTSFGYTSVGCEARADGRLLATADDQNVAFFNRKTSDGDIAIFYKDNSTVGSIGVDSSNDLYINGANDQVKFYINGSTEYEMDSVRIYPATDNANDLGLISRRWDDIYATNGTIQTSDRNEKQDIEELSEAEQRVAVAAKGLLRKFRWKSAVEEKGDDARIHFGIIAQDLQAAFEAEGLDAGRYAMFIYSEWWETYTDVPAVEAVDAVYETVTDEQGNETQVLVSEAVEAKEAYTRTDTYETEEEAPEGAVKKSRMGVRYSELLAFIIAAI